MYDHGGGLFKWKKMNIAVVEYRGKTYRIKRVEPDHYYAEYEKGNETYCMYFEKERVVGGSYK